MARDYKRENELKKAKGTIKTFDRLSMTLPKTLNSDFTAKVEMENTTKSAKIKELISNYTYSGKD